MARCPNYSQATATKFLRALEWGATEAEALAYAGIDVATLRTWRRRKPDFARRVDEVLADGITTHLDHVQASAKGGLDVDPNWRASIFLAQRQAVTLELARLRELTTDAV